MRTVSEEMKTMLVDDGVSSEDADQIIKLAKSESGNVVNWDEPFNNTLLIYDTICEFVNSIRRIVERRRKIQEERMQEHMENRYPGFSKG